MSGQQLFLPLSSPASTALVEPQTPRSLAPGDIRAFLRRLESLSGGRVAKLTLTRNRSTILSAKALPSAGGFPKRVHVRIHRCFVEAPDDVLQAVADFSSKRLTKPSRRAALEVLREYFDQNAPASPPPRPRRDSILPGPTGRVHDLAPLYERLNGKYFDHQLDLTVSWGAPVKRRRRRRRTIQLGSFQDETQAIRLHPILDRRDVPVFVVEAVLHHEMVHAVVPSETCASGNRRRVHTAEFRRREREFEQFTRAERWLGRHLFRLMGKVERELG